jgi:hypothetical protein
MPRRGAFRDIDTRTGETCDEWLTPPELIRALGSFDLDPCAPRASRRPWATARRHYALEDDGDGLRLEWSGRIWCNPPYGKQTGAWLSRLAAHGDGVALTFARTETRMFFQEVWSKADALLFIEKRLGFYRVDGTRPKGGGGGAPSVLIAYGAANVEALRVSGLEGAFIDLRGARRSWVTSGGDVRRAWLALRESGRE